ncbi:FAD-binding oxidoreductase [Halioglobus japonicus]|uniref:FAD-binding oxidoreductase n=1 Tax=Halioglobus japonicus TaxID=930805 RepID=A0AAP8MHP7_9GAMM|nr:FAD-binding oxidoreductase [Halioglobus japonicus]AQA18959.1 FAD-binding oxidoreductase [Halioglobus japonicus]PLW88026.1 FAD-binding oxidoreductase [Halioglobus japonicus]GHD20498.1 oxidoreductase [Halioglobus japonicus]
MNLIEQLQQIVGANGVLTGDDVRSRPNHSWGRGECPAMAIVRPRTTEEVSRIMALCHAQEQRVVPWGGLTGLVDGITCEAGDLVLSMERMQNIEHCEPDAGTLRVQAGAVLQSVQDAAAEAGWQFAVDLGGRGSAQIGGLVATNAGGNAVVRYGMMREQVLGLEVVLADGRVMSSLNEVLKNNAGYDMKQLFIGSEGTLGIVTRAVLRLRPAANARQTAFLGMNSFDDVAALLRHLQSHLEGKLSSFEVMWANHYRFMVEELATHQTFLPVDYPYYVLVESEGQFPDREEALFTSVLGELMEEGTIADAVIAQSGQQAEQLWAMRDDVASLIEAMAPMAAFDISLPLRDMQTYVAAMEQGLAKRLPEARVVVFGHLGDGNIHLVVGNIPDHKAVEEVVYGELRNLGGSISAEHGIGLEKRDYLAYSKGEIEIDLMRTLKHALDPKGILNPGKVISA